MSVLPWSVLGLDDHFSCAAIQLRLGGAGYLDHLEHGRVTKPETVNSRTHAGVQGGLFDHEIFGALADGYDDFADFKTKVEAELAARPADDEPTPPHPRRDRFGRVDLCEPLVHPLLLLRGASWLERATNMKLETVREVIHRERHVVVEASGRGSVSTITADELGETSERDLERLGLVSGSVAIRELLRRNGHAIDPLVRVVHVIPVQLRPVLAIESTTRERFAWSDLNDLYRRVINRNNRLARLHELNAPEIIVRNERVQLQSAVDQLFDNGASVPVVTGPGQRPLESLWDLAGGAALGERLRGLDRWVADRGYAALERGLPGALFRTWRAIQAMSLELGEP